MDFVTRQLARVAFIAYLVATVLVCFVPGVVPVLLVLAAIAPVQLLLSRKPTIYVYVLKPWGEVLQRLTERTGWEAAICRQLEKLDRKLKKRD